MRSATNPDPARDDYHYQRNPLGTEGNGEHEAGEPFEDTGLDGVAGTCQIGQPPGGSAGCYDVGEGNGRWDLSPNVARGYESDVLARMSKLTDAQRRRISLWFDAGIRDQAQMETHLLELMDHIDATYRTKQPSRAQVTP